MVNGHLLRPGTYILTHVVSYTIGGTQMRTYDISLFSLHSSLQGVTKTRSRTKYPTRFGIIRHEALLEVQQGFILLFTLR
jgi:hypothetical protein